jgi:hypothetical protein
MPEADDMQISPMNPPTVGHHAPPSSPTIHRGAQGGVDARGAQGQGQREGRGSSLQRTRSLSLFENPAYASLGQRDAQIRGDRFFTPQHHQQASRGPPAPGGASLLQAHAQYGHPNAPPMHSAPVFAQAPAYGAPTMPPSPFVQGWPHAAPPPPVASYKMRVSDAVPFDPASHGDKTRSTPVRNWVFDSREWLSLNAAALADHARTPDLVVRIMAQQLRGAAKEWYRQLCEQDPWNQAFRDPESFMAAVQKKFTDPNQQLHALSRLDSLRQQKGPDGLRNLIKEFNDIMVILGKEKDPHNKYEFVKRLLPKYFDWAMNFGYIEERFTLADVQHRLEQYELHVQEAKLFHPAFQPGATKQPSSHDRGGATPMELGATEVRHEGGGRGKGGRKGGRAGGRTGRGPGPESSQLPDPEKARRRRLREEGRCFHCEQTGHVAADCKAKAPQGNDQGAQ